MKKNNEITFRNFAADRSCRSDGNIMCIYIYIHIYKLGQSYRALISTLVLIPLEGGACLN